MKRNSKIARGFTLIEMMFALVLGIIVLAPLYIVTKGLSQTSDTHRMDIEAMQRARVGVDALIRDFKSAGLNVSPNSEIDGRCYNRNITGSSAQFRRAVAHLNRGAEGNDAVLLSGNFLGSKVYEAFVDGNEVELRNITSAECADQFSGNYAFAHIVGPTGRSLDARIDGDAEFSSGLCTFQVESGDLSAEVVGDSDMAYVSSNQTAFIWVESSGGRNQLVRYFVDYQSGSSADGDCSATGVSEIASVTLPGDSSIVTNTRKVLVDYVHDFQVWFRPVTRNGVWTTPHHHSAELLVGEVGGNFERGFVLPDAAYVMPLDVNGAISGNTEHISCAASDSANIGPERVRSAIIRLSVRTEKTDQSLNFSAYSGANSRIVDQTLSGYSWGGADAGAPENKPGTAFHLKTLVVEVFLPNLAARHDIVANYL